MADSTRPTVTEVAATVEGVEQRIVEIAESLDTLQQSRTAEVQRIETALGALASLDRIAHGIADMRRLLVPLHQLVPPTTALPLGSGVAEALTTIREALGGPDRDTNFAQVPTDFDGPVGFIGEAVPLPPTPVAPHYPYPYPEQVP